MIDAPSLNSPPTRTPAPAGHVPPSTAPTPALPERAAGPSPFAARLIGGAVQFGAMLAGFALLLAVWHLVSLKNPDLPGPAKTLPVFWEMLRNPTYDNGPNDKGIALQLLQSLQRVFTGFGIGSLIAIPIGLLMGANRAIMRILNPVVQILRPVSPLAWYPIGLTILRDSPKAVIFAIVITSLWPTLINTMVAVSGLPQDFQNVARVFRFTPLQFATKVVIPFALPQILTGLRLSMGIAWVVIVAGEMLAGGTGVGYFVWDSYNAGSIEKVLCGILVIGIVGLGLDRIFEGITQQVRRAAGLTTA